MLRTFHSLLRRLGAGFEDVFPGMGSASNARVKSILAMLREDDEGQQIAGLTELCEYISISTEDSLISFPTEQAVPILVQLLTHEHNPDIMLLAARALTFLADVFPPSCISIIRHGAVPAFCARLLTIEFIDLAEQSLQALEKLSHNHASTLLREGALVAVLSFIDFFQTGVQRVAVATAANISSAVTVEHVDTVSTTAPILINLLRNSDGKIVDSACLALTFMVEAFSKSPTHMEMLVGFGLINSIVDMVSVNEQGSLITSQLSSSTFYKLMKILATSAKTSHVVAENLLQAGMSGTIHKLLSMSPLLSPTSPSPGSMLRSGDQLQDLVALSVHLLPAVPFNATKLLDEELMKTSMFRTPVETEDLALSNYLDKNPQVINFLANDLFSVMLRVYASSASSQVKQQSLTMLCEILYHAPAMTLSQLLADLPVSSLIARLLKSTDSAAIVTQALLMAEILLTKLPDIFGKHFLKEGVGHALEELASSVPLLEEGDQELTLEAENEKEREKEREKMLSLRRDHLAASEESNAKLMTPSHKLARATLARCARKFINTFFTDIDGNPIGRQTQGTRVLETIKARFPARDALMDLFAALLASGDDAITTFELLSSGVLFALRDYLTGADLLPCERNSATEEDEKKEENAVHVLDRFIHLVSAAATCTLDAQSGSSSLSVSRFVMRLQEAFTATEKFQVLVTDVSIPFSRPLFTSLYFGGRGLGAGHSIDRLGTSSGIGSNMSRGLSALSTPIKVRLARAPGVTSLRDYSSNVVLIEPLATLTQVEDFLWNRIQRRDEDGRVGREEAVQSQPGGRGRRSQPREEQTKEREIPKRSTRMTRSQARAAAEAEVAGDNLNDKGEQKGEHKDRDHDEGPKSVHAFGKIDMEGDGGDHVERDEEDEDDFDIGDIGEYVEGVLDEDEDDLDDDEDFLDDVATHVHEMNLSEDHSLSRRHNSLTKADSSRSPSYARAVERNLSTQTSASDQGEPRLTFSIGESQLDPSTTVFQAIQRVQSLEPGNQASTSYSTSAGQLWSNVHTLVYKPFCHQGSPGSSALQALQTSSIDVSEGEKPQIGDIRSLASNLEKAIMRYDDGKATLGPLQHEGTAQEFDVIVLQVLSLLSNINRFLPKIARTVVGIQSETVSTWPGGVANREVFINRRLTSKLEQQLKDVVAVCGGTLPEWCTVLPRKARFLFPFEVRRHLFYCTSFSLGRVLVYLQHSFATEHGRDGSGGAVADRDTGSSRLGRIQRQKVRISRDRVLESAHKIFDLYATSKSQLEVEFFGEAGSGLGPTLEFYTLVSHELQRKSLNLWRDVDNSPGGPQGKQLSLDDLSITPDTNEMVTSPFGLFPRPLRRLPGKKGGSKKEKAHVASVLKHFKLLGRFVAKALQDGRLLDLYISPIFYRLALGHQVDLFDLRALDPGLGESMEKLFTALRHESSRCDGKRHDGGAVLQVDGCPIEDLCLTFTLPGDPDFELRPNGGNIIVNSTTLEEYIESIMDAMFGSGITAQLEAFREGFSAIFPISSLEVFYEDEIETLLCGGKEAWTVEGLTAVIKCDHGYTLSSPPVVALIEVLAELDNVDQKKFVRFVTGTPRLPHGGLAGLQPRLTVVKKLSAATASALSTELGASLPSPSQADAALSASIGSGNTPGRGAADGDLPSVMTCANYLKLPPYSSKDILRERLLFAIREGQGSFDLS